MLNGGRVVGSPMIDGCFNNLMCATELTEEQLYEIIEFLREIADDDGGPVTVHRVTERTDAALVRPVPLVLRSAPTITTKIERKCRV